MLLSSHKKSFREGRCIYTTADRSTKEEAILSEAFNDRYYREPVCFSYPVLQNMFHCLVLLKVLLSFALIHLWWKHVIELYQGLEGTDFRFRFFEVGCMSYLLMVSVLASGDCGRLTSGVDQPGTHLNT